MQKRASQSCTFFHDPSPARRGRLVFSACRRAEALGSRYEGRLRGLDAEARIAVMHVFLRPVASPAGPVGVFGVPSG